MNGSLAPWLRQRHNEIAFTYVERMGDSFATLVWQEVDRLQLP